MVFRLKGCRDITLNKTAQVTHVGRAPLYLHYYTSEKFGSYRAAAVCNSLAAENILCLRCQLLFLQSFPLLWLYSHSRLLN